MSVRERRLLCLWVLLSMLAAVLASCADQTTDARRVGRHSLRLERSWDAADELFASDAVAQDAFGRAVAIDGNQVLIGAPGRQAAYLFDYVDGVWSEQYKLEASDAQADDEFAAAVAIDGNYAAIGAPGKGAVYMFERDGDWMEQDVIITTGGDDRFGASVALSGDYLLVGAPDRATGGAAIVYARSGDTWSMVQELGTPEAGARHGTAVALSDSTALVGAPGVGDSGRATVFVLDGLLWTEQATLSATDSQADDDFGAAVHVAGDDAIVGAPGDDTSGTDEGSAYVFSRTGEAWMVQKKLSAARAASGDHYGGAVAIGPSYGLVAAADAAPNGDGSGAVAVFASDKAWAEQELLTAPEGLAGDAFGAAVGLAGSHAIVGMPGDDDLADDAGSAVTFRLVLGAGEPCQDDQQCQSGTCVEGCCDAPCSSGQGGSGSSTSSSSGAPAVVQVPVYQVDSSCDGDHVGPILYYVIVDDGQYYEDEYYEDEYYQEEYPDAYYVEEDCGGDPSEPYENEGFDEEVGVDTDDDPAADGDCASDTSDTTATSDSDSDCGGDTTDTSSSSDSSDCGGDTSTSSSGSDDGSSSDSDCGSDSSTASSGNGRQWRKRPRMSFVLFWAAVFAWPLRRRGRGGK